jgi:iron complex transport system substrate-binding protein
MQGALRFKLAKFFLSCLFVICFFGVSLAKNETIKITDQAGREVVLPKKIERIVALHGTLRYIVYLKAFDKVVGIEGFEKQRSIQGNPAVGRAYWNAIADRIDKLPVIGEGGPGKLPDFEKLITVKPDVIFTHEPDLADIIQKRTGIPVVVLASIGTQGFKIEDVYELLRFLGILLNKEKRAEELIHYLRACIEDLKKRSERNGRMATVYVGAVSMRGHHGFTSTQANYPPLLWLNLKNVVDELGAKRHVFVDREKLLLWNPDYIFIDANGFSLVADDYRKNKTFYQRLKAVKNEKVYTLLPFNFYRANIELMLINSYFIGKTVHEKGFVDLNFERKAREILKTFLGVDPYDNLVSTYPAFKKVKFTEREILLR